MLLRSHSPAADTDFSSAALPATALSSTRSTPTHSSAHAHIILRSAAGLLDTRAVAISSPSRPSPPSASSSYRFQLCFFAMHLRYKLSNLLIAPLLLLRSPMKSTSGGGVARAGTRWFSFKAGCRCVQQWHTTLILFHDCKPCAGHAIEPHAGDTWPTLSRPSRVCTAAGRTRQPHALPVQRRYCTRFPRASRGLAVDVSRWVQRRRTGCEKSAAVGRRAGSVEV